MLFIMTACVHPVSESTRSQVSPGTDLSMVSEDPVAYVGSQLLLGGAIITNNKLADGCEIEVMAWHLNRWGEPTALDDAGRRFLVKSSEELDPEVYEPGVLVTLAGVVEGQETRQLDDHDYSYPVFTLVEIHLWDSPFRYGLHRNIDPGTPEYVEPEDGTGRHPYDPGYSNYPYSPYWLRNSVNSQ